MLPTPASATTTDPYYLNWRDRPEETKACISGTFKRLECQKSSHWGIHNGSHCYGMCGVNEHELMKALIKQGYPEQKRFYALDIGAGNFQWLEGLAKFLQAQGLPSDIEVHIIGVRGESYAGVSIEYFSPQIRLYRLGSFKVEEIGECLPMALRNFGLFVEKDGGLDLCITRWCARHLVEPVGTEVQKMSLVREGGVSISDGYYFELEDHPAKKGDNAPMINLLFETKAPFLMSYHDENFSLNQFILRKVENIQLPLSYVTTKRRQTGFDIGSECITVFKRTVPANPLPLNIPSKQNSYKLHGDRDLFRFLKRNNCLIKDQERPFFWDYLKKEDKAFVKNLSEKILSTVVVEVKSALEEGADIDQQDATRSTPLHLAIRHDNRELFLFLLENGASLSTADEKGITPMQEMVLPSTDPYYLLTLTQQEPTDLTARLRLSFAKNDALRFAVDKKNARATEILLGDGVFLSRERALVFQQDAVFSHLVKRRELLFSNDLTQVQIALSQGASIRELDTNRCTPLQIAIKKHNAELFHFLLKTFPSHNNPFDLEKAISADREGFYLSALLERKAMPWIPSAYLLLRAIKKKNLKAIELLLTYGATISEKAAEELEDEAFSPLRERGLIS